MTVKDEDIQKLLKEFQKKLEDAQERKFTILLLGRTGVGKSSTVNSLLGQHVAKVGDNEPTTATIEIYESTVEDIYYRIVDTPGLCDTEPQRSHDKYYLGLVRAEVPQLDCLWFVTKLNESRLGGDEPRGIRLITEALGVDVWERAIIVFTHSDTIDADKYHEKLEVRTNLIRNEIAFHINRNGGDIEVASSIPAVAVSNISATTPDKRLWLGPLYTTVLSRISEGGFLPFFLATAHRVGDVEYKENNEIITTHTITDVFVANSKPPPILLTRSQRQEIIRQLDAQIIPGLIVAGTAVGAVFGPLGILIGGTVGAAMGLIVWLFSR